MTAGQLLIGPLGPFDPAEDTHVLERHDGRWVVSERATAAPLRLSDANPSGKVQLWAAPTSVLARQLDVSPGHAELFSDGLLIAAIAPGEWLALTPGPADALLTMLQGLSGVGDHALLVDRSAGLAAFRLTGDASATLLAALCDAMSAGDAGGSSGAASSSAAVSDGGVLTAPVAGIRCTIIRDDLLPEELVGADEAPPEPDAPLVRSFLLVCDRSVARGLYAKLLEAGETLGIEREGFARYRSYHRDV